jgi:hypothetical protein
MSKKRNISGGPLDVPLLDRVVDAGEVAEVPDFQPAHNPKSVPGDPDYLPIIWPPDKWEDVPDPVVAPEAKRPKRAPASGQPVPGVDPVSSDPRER